MAKTKSTPQLQPSPTIENKNERPISRPLQLIGIYTGIGTSILSLFFAYYAIRLTVKYGESQAQIDTLSTLAYNQRIQTDTLITILSELKYQTNRKGLMSKFENTYEKTQFLHSVAFGRFDKLAYAEKRKHLITLFQLLEQEITNPYLLEDDSSANVWNGLHKYIGNILGAKTSKQNEKGELIESDPEKDLVLQGIFMPNLLPLYKNYCDVIYRRRIKRN